jgi:hypothetical protein
MWKVTNLIHAMEISDRESLDYGLCVFDNYWYVGTREQLKEIGVLVVNP